MDRLPQKQLNLNPLKGGLLTYSLKMKKPIRLLYFVVANRFMPSLYGKHLPIIVL